VGKGEGKGQRVGKRRGQGLGKSGRRVKGWVKIGGQESKGGEKGRASVR
jgi:hypothetical protein